MEQEKIKLLNLLMANANTDNDDDDDDFNAQRYIRLLKVCDDCLKGIISPSIAAERVRKGLTLEEAEIYFGLISKEIREEEVKNKYIRALYWQTMEIIKTNEKRRTLQQEQSKKQVIEELEEEWER